MCPDWESNPQHLWRVGWCSNQLSHLARALLSIFLKPESKQPFSLRLILLHYWGKNPSEHPIHCLGNYEVFSLGQVGTQTICSMCELWVFFSNLLRWFFLQLYVVSLHAFTNLYSVEDSRGILCRSPELSLCAALCSPGLCLVIFRNLGLPEILLVFSAQRDCWPPPGLHLSALWLRIYLRLYLYHRLFILW